MERRSRDDERGATAAASDVLWDHWRRAGACANWPEAVRPPTREAGYAIQAASNGAARFRSSAEDRGQPPAARPTSR